MAAFSDRQASILSYCRIDDPTPEDLALLELLHDAAVGYLTHAGIPEPEAGSARRSQYDLAVCYLVLDGYDQRSTTMRTAVVADNPAFRRLLTQLKLTAPTVSDSDTVGTGA